MSSYSSASPVNQSTAVLTSLVLKTSPMSKSASTLACCSRYSSVSSSSSSISSGGSGGEKNEKKLSAGTSLLTTRIFFVPLCRCFLDSNLTVKSLPFFQSILHPSALE
eukprot:Lithocolla_globosa_v1_NODE_4175_length_1489_cov_53.351878.p3 type:complete len:108 gc:universal NODE_4175_length_1489_cov_53.351878:368-691(+)